MNFTHDDFACYICLYVYFNRIFDLHIKIHSILLQLCWKCFIFLWSLLVLFSSCLLWNLILLTEWTTGEVFTPILSKYGLICGDYTPNIYLKTTQELLYIMGTSHSLNITLPEGMHMFHKNLLTTKLNDTLNCLNILVSEGLFTDS